MTSTELEVPCFAVELAAGGMDVATPSQITARACARFAGEAPSFKSVFVWPYNNVCALGNFCAHLLAERAAGLRTRYLVLLDMRFPGDASHRHLHKIAADPYTAVIMYNVSAVSEMSTGVPEELFKTLTHVISSGSGIAHEMKDGVVPKGIIGIPIRRIQPADPPTPPPSAKPPTRRDQMADDLTLLGLDPTDQTLTLTRIRKQYKRVALESHPDKNDPAEAAACAERFHRVHEAFKRIELFFGLPRKQLP